MQRCCSAFCAFTPILVSVPVPPLDVGCSHRQGRPHRVSGLPQALVPVCSPRARRGGPGEPDAVPEAGGGVPHRAAALPDAGAVPQVLRPAQQEPPHQRESARRAGPAEHAQGGSPQPLALPRSLHGRPKKRPFFLGRRSWRSCRPSSSCWTMPRSPRRSSRAGRKSTRTCTRSCRSAGHSGRARMAAGSPKPSRAPQKRQPNPDTPPPPQDLWHLHKTHGAGGCLAGFGADLKAQTPPATSPTGAGRCRDALAFFPRTFCLGHMFAIWGLFLEDHAPTVCQRGASAWALFCK